MNDLASFLSTVGIVQGLEPEQVAELAGACTQERHQAGAPILRQGAHSSTLYFLRSGTLAVRTMRAGQRVTVAHLEPPAIAGEVSFATGRTCSADVDVTIDATLVALTLAALNRLPVQRAHLLHGLAAVIAERLHTTMTRGIAVSPRPVVLVRRAGAWVPPGAFAAGIAEALVHEMEMDSLIVSAGGPYTAEPDRIGDRVWRSSLSEQDGSSRRTALAERMTSWVSRFGAIVLDGTAMPLQAAGEIATLATHQVWLVGPGEPVPETAEPTHIVVQDSSAPTLPYLSGWRRLANMTSALGSGGSGVPAGARPPIEVIARAIVGRQIGLALGGGGAWGWAHIGALEVLEREAIPVDAIAGCSMGCVIGGMRASGATIADLLDLAEYWKRSHRRWSELRFWRLHVANERRLTSAFRHLFGDRRLERFATPFWANAIDIETGDEVVIKDGTLVDAVRASMAFPGWTPPVRRGERLLVDAALINPVPSSLVQQMHCDRVIAVNTLGPMRPHKLETRLPGQAYDVLDRYVRLAAHEVGRVHGQVAAGVTISPQVGDSTMLSFDRTEELIDAGRRAAEEGLALVREAVQPRAARTA